jgi:hypothetical protein
MWTYDALETSMDAIEKMTYSSRKVAKAWNIPLIHFVIT